MGVEGVAVVTTSHVAVVVVTEVLATDFADSVRHGLRGQRGGAVGRPAVVVVAAVVAKSGDVAYLVIVIVVATAGVAVLAVSVAVSPGRD